MMSKLPYLGAPKEALDHLRVDRRAPRRSHDADRRVDPHRVPRRRWIQVGSRTLRPREAHAVRRAEGWRWRWRVERRVAAVDAQVDAARGTWSLPNHPGLDTPKAPRVRLSTRLTKHRAAWCRPHDTAASEIRCAISKLVVESFGELSDTHPSCSDSSLLNGVPHGPNNE